MARKIYDDELKQLVPMDQAIAESVFYTEFSAMKDALKDQKDLSLQILFGVVVAFILFIGGVVYESVQFHSTVSNRMDSTYERLDAKMDVLSERQVRLETLLIGGEPVAEEIGVRK